MSCKYPRDLSSSIDLDNLLKYQLRIGNSTQVEGFNDHIPKCIHIQTSDRFRL